MQKYDGEVNEKSTFRVNCAWKNSGGGAVTPDSATWTLTDRDGTTINSRSAVSITGLSTDNDIVLSGDDLAFQASPDNGQRVLTVEAAYDSIYGSNLPLKDEYHFKLRNLVNVT